MKAVKVILGIVTVLVIIFFSTGLIIKETTYQVKTTVNKPVAEVFSLFNDQSKLKEWMPEVQLIEPITIKPGIVGSEYFMTVTNNGQTKKMKEKVLAYIENKKVTLYFDTDDMLKTDDFTFSEKERLFAMMVNRYQWEEQKKMGLTGGLIRFSIGLDADIDRTYTMMRDCMVKLNILKPTGSKILV